MKLDVLKPSLLLLLAGCWAAAPSPLVPVSGKVTLGGQPIVGAQVFFFPIEDTLGAGSSSLSGQDGSYVLVDNRLMTEGTHPGKYKVVISTGSVVPVDGSAAITPERIPSVFTNPESTPLILEVPAQGGPLNIDLPSRRK